MSTSLRLPAVLAWEVAVLVAKLEKLAAVEARVPAEMPPPATATATVSRSGLMEKAPPQAPVPPLTVTLAMRLQERPLLLLGRAGEAL